MKIIKTDDIKETNKESVYRVNIKLVPVIDDDMADKNLILISLNSIYNLFYTPKSIINKNHNKDINFSINNENLIKINNPTPYFITIAEAKIDDIDILNKRITLSPFKNYSIKDKKITKNIKDKKVNWKRVDEFGKIIIATPKELVYE